MKNMMRTIYSLILLLAAQTLYAHDARPVVINVSEQAPDLYYATVRVPPVLNANNLPVLAWPDNCSNQAAATGSNTWLCEGGLDGQTFSLLYPNSNPSLASFFSISFLDGNSRNMMLTPSESSWIVEGNPTVLDTIVDYTILGFEHIMAGLDHLLFVLGLLVVAGTPKRILLTVTGFTVAHSITLFLSTLGLVNVPVPPVEAVIALSILFLAHEIARNKTDSWTYRVPVVVSFGFGLLHGLGFASALGEVGVAANQLVVSLLFFNVGVELGQLTFIAVVILLYEIFKQAYLRVKEREFVHGVSSLNFHLMIAYCIGIPSAYWVIDRSAGFLF